MPARDTRYSVGNATAATASVKAGLPAMGVATSHLLKRPTKCHQTNPRMPLSRGGANHFDSYAVHYLVQLNERYRGYPAGGFYGRVLASKANASRFFARCKPDGIRRGDYPCFQRLRICVQGCRRERRTRGVEFPRPPLCGPRRSRSCGPPARNIAP